MKEIYIQEPCKAKWNSMNLSGEGRFCNSCSLTVVDFTKMTNEEISNYFLKKSGQRVCGNFRNDQVSTPKLVRRRKRWGWLLTVLTIVFGSAFISSCRRHIYTHTLGDARIFQFTPSKTTKQHEKFPDPINRGGKDFHHVTADQKK
jgi:hypothetical protein